MRGQKAGVGAMNELTYGELMMLCEGHGTSRIYERHQEVVVALRQRLADCDRERTQARDERNEFYNATVTLRSQVAKLEHWLQARDTRIKQLEDYLKSEYHIDIKEVLP